MARRKAKSPPLPWWKMFDVTRCAIYTRQSAEPRSELTSCQVQLAICLDFMRKHPRWVMFEGNYFEDIAESGASVERPAFQRLLERIRAREIDRVIIYRLDRISRNLLDFVATARLMKEHDVGLSIATAPELGSAALEGAMLNVVAAFAEFEREMIRDRIRDARAAHKLRGRRIAGRVPFGYRADARTKQLVPEPVETACVCRMFQLAAGGATAAQIAATMNELGWRTNRNGTWTARQVLETLSNPVYLGRFREGDGTRAGVHDAIIDEDLFLGVQAGVAERRTHEAGPRASAQWPACDWLLSGLLKCAECGRPMSRHTARRAKTIARYYRCRSTASGRPPCAGQMVAADEIEGYVLERLRTPEEVGDVGPEILNVLAKLVPVWDLLLPWFREWTVRALLEEVRFDARTGTVQIAFDMEGVQAFAARAQGGAASGATPSGSVG